MRIEGTARYAGLVLAPAEGFGRGFFFALWSKKELFLLVLGNFWCLVVTSVKFSSNYSNQKNKKKSKKIKKKFEKSQKS